MSRSSGKGQGVFGAFHSLRIFAAKTTAFSSQGDLLLDIYLHNHVENLYQSIRKKALVQYFSPFLSVDMHKMAQSFNTTVTQLESEVATLVMDGQIQGRIDSHNKVRLAITRG